MLLSLKWIELKQMNVIMNYKYLVMAVNDDEVDELPFVSGWWLHGRHGNGGRSSRN